MGTHSYSKDCPKCNGVDTLMCCNDTRSDYSSGECVNCGFTFWVEEGTKSFKELNEIRVNCYELKPITKKQYLKIIKECNQ